MSTSYINTPNNRGETALHLAAAGGHKRAVDGLREAGADIFAKDNSGQTALQLAARNAHVEVVEQLLNWSLRAKVLLDTLEQTALQPVARSTYEGLVQQLLKRIPGTQMLLDSHEQRVLQVAEETMSKVIDLLSTTFDSRGEDGLPIFQITPYLDLVSVLLHDAKLAKQTREWNRRSVELLSQARRLIPQAQRETRERHARGQDILHFFHKSPKMLENFVKSIQYPYHNRDVHQIIRDLDDVLRPLVRLAIVNTQDNDRRTALHRAAENENDNSRVILLLLGVGAGPNLQDKDGRTALIQVAETGNVGIAEVLVHEDADVNIQDNIGWTALDFAVDRGKVGVVSLLLGGSFRRVQDKQRALQLAIEKEDKAIIQLLVNVDVDFMAQNGQKLLQLASDNGWTDILLLLIAKGVDVKTQNGQKLLERAMDKGWRDILLLLLDKHVDVKSQNGQRLLQLAMKKGWEIILLRLLNEGVDVKTEIGQEALLWATKQNLVDIVELLVKGGVKVSELDDSGVTALQYAVNRKNERIVQLLVKGTDFKTQDASKALLSVASQHGLQEIAKLLVDGGANVNEPDRNKQTALHKAAAAQRWEMVRLLVASGSNPDVEDEEGYTPGDLVEDNSQQYLLALGRG